MAEVSGDRRTWHLHMGRLTPEDGQPAEVGLANSWAGGGTWWQTCLVVAETPKRYRVKAMGDKLTLTGGRAITGGQTALVPKRAVRFLKG